MRTSVRLAVAFLFVAAIGAAQVKESITVSYVELPVTVVDRGGVPIKALTAANFEIIDEGQKRPIAGLDVIDFASAESVAGTSPLNPAARRNFLLVFDLTYSNPLSIGRAQKAARDFVTKTVTRRDRIGVATVDVNRGYRLLTSFTTDRNLVDEAIANPATFRGSDPLELASVGAVTQETAQSTQGESGNDAMARENMKEIMRGSDRMNDQYSRGRIEKQMNLLAGLAKALHAVSGQKHLVLLSEGFDPRVIQGRDASQITAGGGASAETQDAMAAASGEIWKVDNDNRFGSSSSISLLDKMANIAKRSDVIIDAVDIRGLRSDSDASTGFARTSNEGLHLLANSTGGTVFKNSNDLGSDFQRVIKSQEVVYVLAFNAPATQPGRFHNVKVKLVNVPGGRVSGRSGYYEAGGETAVERSLSNAEIITNDIAQDAVHVAALVAPFPTSSANAQVPVILEINGSDLAAAAKNNAESMEVFVYAFDEEGLVRDSLYQRVGLDLGKIGPQLRATGVKYYATLSLPAGRYAVKSLVRIPETDRKGFNRTDVVVPEQGDVALSSPFFFDEGGKWVMIKGGSHDKTNAPYPFEVNGTPFVPSAAVHVKNGEPRRFAVFVRNASPDEMTLATNPEAKVVDQLKSANGAKLVFELDKVPAQQSTLNVTMKKRGSEDQRTASIPISVQ
jgi:VWFA-related protein